MFRYCVLLQLQLIFVVEQSHDLVMGQFSPITYDTFVSAIRSLLQVCEVHYNIDFPFIISRFFFLPIVSSTPLFRFLINYFVI